MSFKQGKIKINYTKTLLYCWCKCFLCYFCATELNQLIILKLKLMKDRISAEMTQQQVDAVLDAISTIKTNMPFLINLSTDERMSLPKMEDSRRPFVEKALEYAESEANIRPPYIDLDELKLDLALFSNMQRIKREIGRLDESVNDTLTAVGSDSYVAALAVYNGAKMAARSNTPGIDHIVDDLKRHFYQDRSKDTQE